MLMKRAMAGALPLIPAAMKLAGEVLSGPLMDDAPSGPFAEDERIVAGAKKAFLLAAGSAVQKYREKLADQQEIVGALANMVMEIYAMESALRRAQKAVAARKTEIAPLLADAARCFVHDSADRLEKEARTALAAVSDGDTLRTNMAVLRRFMKREAVDTIALRRQVADRVYSGGAYPFEAR